MKSLLYRHRLSVFFLVCIGGCLMAAYLLNDPEFINVLPLLVSLLVITPLPDLQFPSLFQGSNQDTPFDN